MKVTASKFDIAKISAECLVCGVWEGDGRNLPKGVDGLTDGAILRFLKKKEKFGKLYEGIVFTVSPKKHKTLEKIVLFGLGKKEKLEPVYLRQFAAAVSKSQTKGAKSLSLYLPKEVKASENAELVVVGFSSGIFDPGHRKTGEESKSKVKVESLEILTEEDLKKVKEGAEKGLIISETMDRVREVVNLPANVCTPEYMVKFAKKIAAENKLKIEVFSEKQVNDMGMGIMASVAKGSEEDLYFVVMRYLGGGSSAKTLALVGKGITFDSGGISIKPGDNMEWMKMDMAGAAACLGAMEVIAKLKPKINVVCAVPLTENLPSGKASKPGDVVKGLSGKTVEIINTDAEGRLVLSDALTYVQNKFKPDYIVDVATLTGAAIVALGNWASAILGRPQNFIDEVIKTGVESGERYWQLPLYAEYRDQLKSYIADIANVSSVRGGGTETGGKFLEEFVGKKTAWAHLDICATAWEEQEGPYASKGATGIPLVTLVNLALSLSQK
ncbi:MAG: leucyl aminopeptidase [Candidatus Curtissbacteria bacterium]|nr:leucyl aminopeptidase [Candidatus Curtissbacteria bacterium]